MTRPAACSRRHVCLGVLIGLVASAGVLSVYDGPGGAGPCAGPRGAVLSDCEGPVRELVIHYLAEASEIVEVPYREFLPRLPPDVTVHVVCPRQSDLEDLVGRLGPTECALSPVVVGHPITVWSRDRWLALGPGEAGAATTLLSPRGEMGAEIWPARSGDQLVGQHLAAALAPGCVSALSEMYFDGGDFVADGRTVFVTPAVLRRNLQHTLRTAQELRERLSAELGRRVVLLSDAPDHHAGMYMMPLGDGTVLVGDPAAARRLVAAWPEEELAALCPPQGPDFSEATTARFEAVARQCEAAGYRVRRIPIVPGRDGRTYVTYLNVILDEREGRRIVYMPVFSRAEVLNRAAGQVWSELGYEVRRIRCDACYGHFGSLRCLVNVLRRG